MTSDIQRPPVRIALMGLGRAVFQEHYPLLKAHPALFDIVAACDIEKDRRDRVAADYPRCRMFRQYADMLDESGIDVVLIATCSGDHVAHAMKSLASGRWTVLEAPIALNQTDAQRLRGAAVKAKGRLIPLQRGLFEPEFLLAKKALDDPRLGAIYQVLVRREDYIRRDDWQTVKRLGGGASYYAMTDLILQALKLLQTPPIQMWSELKRIASLGDAEDYAHVCLKTRLTISADIEYNGGAMPGVRQPAFEFRAERGVFRVEQGVSEGTITMIDPTFAFPRRRSSVRTPKIEDMHETVPVTTDTIRLDPDTPTGLAAFWRGVYETVRVAAPAPVTLDDTLDTVKFAQLMKAGSAFGK